MPGSFSDPNWWPTPPPKPLRAPSAPRLIFGTVVPVLAVVGAIFAMSGFGHSGHNRKQARAGAPPVALRVGASGHDRRQAFQQCLKSMGAGSGFGGGGRFGGGGPSKSFRTAFDVCRSLLQTGGLAPVAPKRTATTPAPAA
jgi:hypothetical protein